MLLRDPVSRIFGNKAQMLYQVSKSPALTQIVGESDRPHQYPSQKPLLWLAGKARARKDWCREEERA